MPQIRLSDLRRKQFMICAAQLTQNEENFHVLIPDDPWIFMSNPARTEISNQNSDLAKQNFWRWAAGGCLVIYKQGNKRIIAPILRDSGSPTYAGHMSLASGLSDSDNDWMNPTKVALKESFEEVAAMLDGRLIVPQIDEIHEEILWNIKEYQSHRLKKMGRNVSAGIIYCPAKFLDKIETQQLTIQWGERITRHHGLVVIDEGTRGIDLIKILEIEIPLGDLIFVDCEDTKSGPLDREIHIFDIDEMGVETIATEKKTDRNLIFGSKHFFKSGKRCPSDPAKSYPMNPPLAAPVKALVR